MSALKAALPLLMTLFTAFLSLLSIILSLLLSLLSCLLSYCFSSLSNSDFKSFDVKDKQLAPITPMQPTQPPRVDSAIETHPRRTSANAPSSDHKCKRRGKQATAYDDLTSSSTARAQGSKSSHAPRTAPSRRRKVKPPPVAEEDNKSIQKMTFKYQDNPFDLPPSENAARRIKITTDVYDKHRIARHPFKRRMDPETADEEMKAFFEKLKKCSSRSSFAARECEDHTTQLSEDTGVDTQGAVPTQVVPITPKVEPTCMSIDSREEGITVDGPVLGPETKLSMNVAHLVMLKPNQVPPPVKMATLGPRDRYVNMSRRATLARTIHTPTRITPGMKNLFLDDMGSLDFKFRKLWKGLDDSCLGLRLSKLSAASETQDEDKASLDMDVDIDMDDVMEVDDIVPGIAMDQRAYGMRTGSLSESNGLADMEDVQSSPQGDVRLSNQVDAGVASSIALPQPAMEVSPPTPILPPSRVPLQCPPIRSHKYRPLLKPLNHLLQSPSPTPHTFSFPNAIGVGSPTTLSTSTPWNFLSEHPIPRFSIAGGTIPRTPSPKAQLNASALCGNRYRRQAKSNKGRSNN